MVPRAPAASKSKPANALTTATIITQVVFETYDCNNPGDSIVRQKSSVQPLKHVQFEFSSVDLQIPLSSRTHSSQLLGAMVNVSEKRKTVRLKKRNSQVKQLKNN